MTTLAFHAASVSVESDAECTTVAFEGERNHELALMNDSESSIRMWWHDARDGQDECIVAIARVELDPTRLRVTFDRARSIHYDGPYDGVDITYDDYDDRFGDLQDVMTTLLAPEPGRLHVRDSR